MKNVRWSCTLLQGLFASLLAAATGCRPCVPLDKAGPQAQPPAPSAPARPGIDIPGFQRIYLRSSPPVVRFEENFDGLSGWRTHGEGESRTEISRAEGPDGGCLRMVYDLVAPGWCTAYKEIAPFSISGEWGMSLRVRCSNPGQTLEVKLIDADEGVFGAVIQMDSDMLEWKEIVIGPDEAGYLWGGENREMNEIRRVEFVVSRNPGAGQVLIDSFQVAEYDRRYVELALSQVGYHPEDRKPCVLRLVGDAPAEGFRYQVVDENTGATFLEGPFAPADFSAWRGKYYVADFRELSRPGTYRVCVPAEGKVLRSSPFEVGENVLRKSVTPAVVSFLHYMRCGDRCHPLDPVPGGYHDTFYDIGKRMWSLTHMIVGLAMTVEAGGVGDLDRNRTDDAMDELLYALSFARRVQLPDGGVGHFGVGHDTPPGVMVDTWSINFEDDAHPRILDTTSDIIPTYYYVGALCKALPVIREKYPVVADETLKAVRGAADYLIGKEPWFTTSFEHGGFVYAMTEMYRLTGEKRYLERVPRHLELLAPLQDLDSSDKEVPVCGDFHLSAEKRTFDFQYKFHEVNMAILLGLANVIEFYEPSSPEWLRSAYMLNVFRECYLKPMSSLTPYRQIAHGVERTNGGYRIAFFSPPDHPWVSAHGFNVDHFAYGYVAMRTGYLFEDAWSEAFADQQMQWVLGANPLRYCMVCGVGANNPVVWSSMHGKPGPIDGGIPNGLVGDRRDFPIWLTVFSSGEYWLPHDDLYLILASLLDRPGQLSGRVARSAARGGRVVVYEGDRAVETLDLDAEGRFGPVDLPPEKEYRVRYEGDDGWAERNILLLAAEDQEVLLDPSGTYDIRLVAAGRNGDKAQVEIVLENSCGRDVQAELAIRAFDGREASAERVDVPVAPGQKVRLERDYAFRDGRPLLVTADRKVLLLPYR